LALLKSNSDAKVLAGGHSLLPAMKLRLTSPTVLVDLGRIAGLKYIRHTGDSFAIGAMTTHAEVESSEMLRASSPLLAETAACIGDVQVRNCGTLGGSLAHADPAADYPAAILALDADIDVAGPNGRRTIRAESFFVDLLQTAIAAGELITEIRVQPTARTVAYVKTEQKASGFALAGVAVVISPSGVRVGVTGIAAKAYRATAVEQTLDGQTTAEAIALAASRAADGVDPLSDIHASAEYRAHLAQVNTRRALERALAR
ncbi:MAG TPA: FAD binding domain-containing protein, partial [Vicinamibacterales bacterium]